MKKAMNNAPGYRCPHCFSILGMNDYHMTCTDEICMKAGSRIERDPERSSLFGIDPNGPDALPAVRHIVRKGDICDRCGKMLKTRVCPRCHHDIPAGAWDNYRNTIMFLAPLNGGLSHYTVSLIDQLSSEFKKNLKPSDSETMECIRKNYRKHIDNGRVIPHSSAPSEPIVYYLNDNKGRPVTLTLVFVDVSCGDDGIPHLDHGTDIRGMIAEASGLVILLDPVTESEVGHTLGILKHVTDLLAASNRMDADGNINVPLAMVVTKCDLLMEDEKCMLGPCSALHIGRDPMVFDEDVFMQIDSEVREIVRRLADNEILNIAQTYSQNQFFAVSAIGYNPVGGSLPRGVIPFRVEDPLIWLLTRRLNE